MPNAQKAHLSRIILTANALDLIWSKLARLLLTIIFENLKNDIDILTLICKNIKRERQNASRSTKNQTNKMQNSYIPSSKADFALWLANFAALIAGTPAAYGLVVGDGTAISAVNTAYQTAYTAATTPETRTSATIAEENAQRASATATVRPYAVTVSRNPAVSNELKTGLGVNLPNSARTPVPAPTTQPVLSHVQSNHLTATLDYRDATTPTSKAKPFGAIALELRREIGTAPAVDPDSAATLALLTKSPTDITFAAGDMGKVVTLWSRWVTRSGPAGVSQSGPWSAALSFGII